MIIGEGKHTFPSRTRSLRTQPPMVVRPRCRARVGRCQNYWSAPSERKGRAFFLLKTLLLLSLFVFIPTKGRAHDRFRANLSFHWIHLSDKFCSREPDGGIAQVGGDFQPPQNGRGGHIPGNSPAERFIIHFGVYFLFVTGIRRPWAGISTTFFAERYSCNA